MSHVAIVRKDRQDLAYEVSSSNPFSNRHSCLSSNNASGAGDKLGADSEVLGALETGDDADVCGVNTRDDQREVPEGVGRIRDIITGNPAVVAITRGPVVTEQSLH